jgi:hypothetical protein
MSGAVSDAWKSYEREVAEHARLRPGLQNWQRRLRTGDNADLLDLDGPLPLGWMVGCKSVQQKTRIKPCQRCGHSDANIGTRLWQAMDQSDQAMTNLAKILGAHPDGVFPFQVLRRTGRPIGEHYAVTTYDRFLDLVELRAKLEG